ncbi:hypothetical protein TNCT_365201 [Trichonephila clavata]|uniref:Uncharacterized protein n=1 Tax=Trichonephila clavata TaxID=2740835 RepID=A0A8X6L1F2_TRICU|nr:hypothetical protein TNCT_365201 [Trichonephila clavata]
MLTIYNFSTRDFPTGIESSCYFCPDASLLQGKHIMPRKTSKTASAHYVCKKPRKSFGIGINEICDREQNSFPPARVILWEKNSGNTNSEVKYPEC